MATMTLKEKADAISIVYLLLGDQTFTSAAWTRFRYGLPLAILLAEDQITVAPGSEAEGFIEELWTWVVPAWEAMEKVRLEESAV